MVRSATSTTANQNFNPATYKTVGRNRFSGGTASQYDKFLKSFKLDWQTRRWTEEQAKMELLAAITGDAKDPLLSTAGSQILTVQGMIDTLSRTYLPPSFSTTLEAEFNNLKYDPHTAMLPYFTKLMDLYRRAHPHHGEDMVVEQATAKLRRSLPAEIYRECDKMTGPEGAKPSGWQIANYYDQKVADWRRDGYFVLTKDLYTGPHGQVKVDDLKNQGMLIYSAQEIATNSTQTSSDEEYDYGGRSENSVEPIHYAGDTTNTKDGKRDSNHDKGKDPGRGGYRNSSNSGGYNRDNRGGGRGYNRDSRGGYRGYNRDSRGNGRGYGRSYNNDQKPRLKCTYEDCKVIWGHTIENCRDKAYNERMDRQFKEMEERIVRLMGKTDSLKALSSQAKPGNGSDTK